MAETKIQGERSSLVRAILRACFIAKSPHEFVVLLIRYCIIEGVPEKQREEAQAYATALLSRAPVGEIQGERSSIVRAAIRTGVSGRKDLVETFTCFCKEEGVPEKNMLAVVAYARDLSVMRASVNVLPSEDLPVNEPEPENEPEPDWAFNEIDKALESVDKFEDDNGFGFDVPEESGSGLTQVVRDQMTPWLGNKGALKFLFKPFRHNKQDFYLISSWRLRAPGFLWNLTGTTGNNPVLHRCGPDILHFEDDTAVCVTEDFEMSWSISKKLFPDSLLCGQTVKVEATVFVWLVKCVPNREWRFWLNEEREPSVRPKGVPPKKDIWRRRYPMKKPA